MVANTSPWAFVVTRIFCARREVSPGKAYVESSCLVCVYETGLRLCLDTVAPFAGDRELRYALLRASLKVLCCFYPVNLDFTTGYLSHITLEARMKVELGSIA